MLIPIADPDDPRIAEYRYLRERDLVGRAGLFVAEGEVVVRVLLSGRSRHQARSLLLSDRRAAALAGWLEELDADLPVYVAPSRLLDEITGFHVHRGVLGIGERGPDAPPSTLLASRGPALCLGLVGLANHDNVGGTLRNAAAFAVDAVLLDDGCCDPLYRKSIRVSTGSALTVPFARAGSPLDMLDVLRRAGFDIWALTPRGEAVLHKVSWGERTAILAGSEGAGLPAEVLRQNRTVRIETVPEVDSLNVANAVAVALHGVRTAGRAAR